jgi:hypothetical protein
MVQRHIPSPFSFSQLPSTGVSALASLSDERILELQDFLAVGDTNTISSHASDIDAGQLSL